MTTLQILETLDHAQTNISEFAKGPITEETFQKNIAELKAVLFQLKAFMNLEQQDQAEEIISYQIISQKRPFQQSLIRIFGTLPNHTWPIANWNTEGKYLYDLEALDLKLSGLIHKVSKSEN